MCKYVGYCLQNCKIAKNRIGRVGRVIKLFTLRASRRGRHVPNLWSQPFPKSSEHDLSLEPRIMLRCICEPNPLQSLRSRAERRAISAKIGPEDPKSRKVKK